MIVLYTTLGCHLCDQAKKVIYSALGYDTRIHECDIADDEALMDAYALKIPVLGWEDEAQLASGDDSLAQLAANVGTRLGDNELPWPFDEAAVVAWYEGVHTAK